MKHVERRRSKYSPAQLFDLVVDVERYPEFVPWVISARVFRRKDNILWTDMTMGTSLLHKRFTTKALLRRPDRIEVSSRDSIFECFDQAWTFVATDQGETDIAYEVDIRLSSRILQAVMGASFSDRAPTMVQAFLDRAERLYGRL